MGSSSRRLDGIDTAVADLARRQHGLVTVTQLGEVGFSRKVVARRAARGQLVKLGTNVLRLAGTTVTWESQVLAHVLAAGDGAVASHRTAAVLWGLDGARRGKPEISVPRGGRYRPSAARVHESTDLDLIQPVVRVGIPTTPIARTLLDLGAVVPEDAVLLAIDCARRRGKVDWHALLSTFEKHARRGRNGVGTMRAILDAHYGEAVTDSAFERLFVSLLKEAGLPEPVLQYELVLGHRAYRLDLAYPDRRVAIELDGSVHLERDVWEADHARQNALILDGWRLLRFTWNDYTNRRPAVLREVRAALRGAPPVEIAADPARNGPSSPQFR